MLKPDERAHLLELLRPPAGCRLDLAIGTTFSLDLLSALMLPLSFAFFDWEHSDGQPVADLLALLEALRRYGDRFTIFCQTGQIRLPAKYPPLVAFLEQCIHEVQAPDEKGVFHPKVWVLRFTGDDEAVRYRVLCLSRNLTFHRCWDTVVALDGELTDRKNAIASNHPLGNFIEALPKLALLRVSPERKQGILKMADELRRVRFTWPEGFDGDQCRFWVGGLEERVTAPFGGRRDRSLIISPFLSNDVVRNFIASSGETHLISRTESLQELPGATLRDCTSVHTLQPELSEEPNDELPATDRGEVLDGLHAKLFVIDRGWEASVFSGSFNATGHALRHNVEFMVELVGKRSLFGVEQFLRPGERETNFADLLQKYDVTIEAAPADPSAQRLDDLFQAIKRAIATARPKLAVTTAVDAEVFDLSLTWTHPPRWPKGEVKLRVWPVTQHRDRSRELDARTVFPRLAHESLTPLMAFAIKAEVDGAKGDSVFVMNLPMEGAPADRMERVLASLIRGQDQLLRYILFLLASGDEASASSIDLVGLLADAENGKGTGRPLPCLLETLLRSLHRTPGQLNRVDSLLMALRKAPNGSALLSEEFQTIWDPIWKVAMEARMK